MSNSTTMLPRTPKRIGIAADHGGSDLKEHLVGMLREAGYKIINFGAERRRRRLAEVSRREGRE